MYNDHISKTLNDERINNLKARAVKNRQAAEVEKENPKKSVNIARVLIMMVLSHK